MKTIPTISFVDAIKLALSKCVSFKGRSRRSEYWWTALAVVIVNVILYLCCFASSNVGVILLYWTINILSGLFMIPIAFRRLHDTGRSGWWYGVFLILNILITGYFIFEVVSLVATSMGMGISADMYSMLVPLVMKYLFFWLVQIIYAIVLLVFLCMDSEQGTNKYGPSPKYIEEEEGTAESYIKI